MKITFRGDGGFCRWRLMRWCDSHGIGYVLGLPTNKVLERMSQFWIDAAKLLFERTGQPQRIFGTFSYAAGTWDRARRVIVKGEHNAQGSNPRFVVSNEPGDPQELYEDVYCQRGEMENRIKEQQLGLFADLEPYVSLIRDGSLAETRFKGHLVSPATTGIPGPRGLF